MQHKSLNIAEFNKLDTLGIEQVAAELSHAESHPIECVNWPDVYNYKPQVGFAIVHSERYIYVKFNVSGEGLRAVNTKNLSPVAQDSCVEFFLKVPGSDEYWNFEFNCIGTVNASHRILRPNAVRLTDDQISQILRYSTCGTCPFEEKSGRQDWSLTIAIPLTLIGINDSLPEFIYGNFYKCADATQHPHYLSWSPIPTEKPNFHTPEYFGKLFLK